MEQYGFACSDNCFHMAFEMQGATTSGGLRFLRGATETQTSPYVPLKAHGR
jgi:hypothetical protein